MKFGIAHLSVVPCRTEPSDRSEQSTQLLFGELLQVYEKKDSWFRIKVLNDRYECWIDENQFTFISQKEFEQLKNSTSYIVNDLAEVLSNSKRTDLMTILIGSALPHLKDGWIRIGEKKWKYEGSYEPFRQNLDKNRLAENAMLFLNAPYQWGGRSPFGIDCSGFVQLIYKLNGFLLPRDASEQAKVGQTLSFIEEAEVGDLAFFDNQEGSITHVGIMLSNNRIIHASGQVRIDKIDHQGIFKVEKNNYSHQLRLITKIF